MFDQTADKCYVTRMMNLFKNDDDVHNRPGLSNILDQIESDGNVRKTVLGILDTLMNIKSNYFPQEAYEGAKQKDADSLDVKKRDGMIIFTNYIRQKYESIEHPPLQVDWWEAEFARVNGNHSVHNEDGKKLLEELLYFNGAVEVNATTGNVTDYQRRITITMKLNGIAPSKLGFDEPERAKRSGEEYRGIGCRHLTGILASMVDHDLYVLLISRQTGVINIFHQGNILYSSIKSEMSPLFNKEGLANYIREPSQLKLEFG